MRLTLAAEHEWRNLPGESVIILGLDLQAAPTFSTVLA
jgi:hypothetical protein